jgi:hypothetical protein
MASTHKSLRSGTANKRPTTAIADGQIALNTNSTSPGLFFKDSTGATIIKIGPVHVGATAPNVSPAAGGSSGNSTGEIWLDTSLTPVGVKIWNGSAWVNATPIGSTTVQGLLELATDAETQAGSDTARAVTPASLQSKVSDSTSTTSSTTIASSTAVKSAYDLANAALPKSGGTITGNLEIGTSGSLSFEGSTADAFETTIAVTDPTADRTITLPDTTGTVVTTGDTGTVTSTMLLDGTIVDGDINASAAIAHSKLANITAGSVLLGNATNVPTATALSGDVTVNNSGVTAISSGVIVDADINASAAIADTKLATIATADKVSLSALNIDGGTDIGAALADADLFIVDDGGAGTNRKAAATRIPEYTFTKVSGDITIGSTGTAAIGSGVIVNADVNASAAIAGTKVSPDFGSQTVTTTGLFSAALGTAGAPTITFTGDTNTGIYSPGADQVAISTSGSGRLFVDSSGRVGVGTSSPSSFNSAANQFVVGSGSGSQGVTIYTGNSAGNQGSIFFADGTTGGAEQAAGYLVYEQNANYMAFGTLNTERMRLDSSGRLGLGTSSPSAPLHVSGTEILVNGQTTATLNLNGSAYGMVSAGADLYLETAGAGNQVIFRRGGTESARFDASGRLGIGTTSPSTALQVIGTGRFGDGTNGIVSLASSGSTCYFDSLNNAATGWQTALFRATNITFATDASSTPSERARIDSSGRLLVGTSTSVSTGGLLQVVGGDTARPVIHRNINDQYPPILYLSKARGTGSQIVSSGDNVGYLGFLGADGTNVIPAASIEVIVDGTPGTNDMPGRLVFSTTADGASSPTERMRIASGGDVLIGTTTGASALTSTSTTPGIGLSSDSYGVFVRGGSSLYCNRILSDGSIVEFSQAGTLEGTISVSGTTVSYNGAHLSRWSQLPGGTERTEILRGTVLSNIDEMCGWGEEENEQLNRMKVSDVEGDPNVSGVFQAWDDDDDTYTDDFYCAMTGDFIIRIAAGTPVHRGQLLMSAGDGTAKPQGDGFVQDKTIAKVTSNHVTCTYDDGSYCVPCVLMAC